MISIMPLLIKLKFIGFNSQLLSFHQELLKLTFSLWDVILKHRDHLWTDKFDYILFL